MKIFISADIEGITGATNWDETINNKPDYRFFQDQMTKEVVAACKGALRAGATEIVVKDAHGNARNILLNELPEEVTLLRGWSHHPHGMMDGIDDSFSAAIMIGYHSGAGSGSLPLSHTLSGGLQEILLNDVPMTEFHISAYTAALFGVPVSFVSADEDMCRIVSEFDPAIRTVWGSSGRGEMVKTLHPAVTVRSIEEEVYQSLLASGDSSDSSRGDRVKVPEVPAQCIMDMTFKIPSRAYKASHYPGMKMLSDVQVRYETADFYKLLQMLMFVVW